MPLPIMASRRRAQNPESAQPGDPESDRLMRIRMLMKSLRMPRPPGAAADMGEDEDDLDEDFGEDLPTPEEEELGARGEAFTPPAPEGGDTESIPPKRRKKKRRAPMSDMPTYVTGPA